MITTFPGLYYVATGAAEIIGIFTRVSTTEICASTLFLRVFNLIYLFGSFYQLYALLKHHQPKSSTADIDWKVLALTLFPLHFFFHFMYYTDAGSTFFVLLCYNLTSQRRFIVGALAGVVAVAFRQTNIVWVSFAAFAALLERVERTMPASSRGQK